MGGRWAGSARGLLRHLSFNLAGAQLGITITSLAIGVMARPAIAAVIEPVIEPVVGPTAVAAVSLGTAFVIATLVQMVVAELFPKGLAIAHPEETARILALPLTLYARVFGPFIRFLDGSANRVVRALGVEPSEELSQVRSLPELELLISAAASEGVLGGTASTLLTRSIRFAHKTAADALVPRVSVVAIGTDETVADLVERAMRTGFSRFPVFARDIDDIVGVARVKAAHTVPIERRVTTPVSDVMDAVQVVPETRDLEGVLADMKARHQHLMVVTDEYGGTAGIITLEDVVEEIVGEIDDEHDRPVFTSTRRGGDRRLSGSLHPDELEELTGLAIPDGEYETLAGFILDRLGHIPEIGERIEFDGRTIEVVAMDRRRITEVTVTPDESGTGPR